MLAQYATYILGQLFANFDRKPVRSEHKCPYGNMAMH